MQVTRRGADDWSRDQMKNQQEKDRKPPKPIDPTTAVFFDPISGQPKVWYWRSEAGLWEFYDNKGFHPRTGDELKIVSGETLTRWQQEIEAAKQRRTRTD